MGLIPAADLIKSAAGVAKVMALDGGKANVTYELKIEEKATRLTRIYRDPSTHGGCEADKKLRDLELSDTETKVAESQGTQPEKTLPLSDFIVEDVGEDKKTSDDNTIKVSGSIQLPKPKDPAKPAAK